MVSLKRGACLINSGNFGTSNPYGILTLEDLHCRSMSAKLASVDPEWNENFIFPLDLNQWATMAKLKIQIWNRDVYLSDDFLGLANVDIGKLPLECFGSEITNDEEGMDLLLGAGKLGKKRDRDGFALPEHVGKASFG